MPSRGVVSLVKKRTRREKEEEGKGTRALNLLFKLQAVCVCARVYDVCNTPSSYRQPGGRWAVVVEEVLYTLGVVVLVRSSTAR